MGVGFSSSSPSYQQYKNDFELVIRSTKDLEYLLETSFGAPSGKQVGVSTVCFFFFFSRSLRTTLTSAYFYDVVGNSLFLAHLKNNKAVSP